MGEKLVFEFVDVWIERGCRKTYVAINQTTKCCAHSMGQEDNKKPYRDKSLKNKGVFEPATIGTNLSTRIQYSYIR